MHLSLIKGELKMEELGLSFDNILDDDGISSLLFEGGHEETTPPPSKEETGGEPEEKKDTAEVDPDDMFEEKPESVGSEENNKGNKEDTNPQKGGSSPDFFSFIATAFAEEGIFPDLDEETIGKIKTAQDFRDAVNEQIRAGLTEQQKRVAEALDNGADVDQVRQYEQVIGWLNAQEEPIKAEGDAGDKLRRNIILQDYLNKGFEEARAKSMVDKIFEDGTELKEAQDALKSLQSHYTKGYQKLRDDAKAEADEEAKKNEQKAARIRKSIIEDKMDFFNGIEISKEMRQKAFDAISKPVYKDPKTGDTYTAVQKLELDNGEEFLAKLGLIYALTDGLTSLDGLIKKKANKEVKKGFSELERKINGTVRDSHGNLTFASGVNDDSFIGKGMKLDL